MHISISTPHPQAKRSCTIHPILVPTVQLYSILFFHFMDQVASKLFYVCLKFNCWFSAIHFSQAFLTVLLCHPFGSSRSTPLSALWSRVWSDCIGFRQCGCGAVIVSVSLGDLVLCGLSCLFIAVINIVQICYSKRKQKITSIMKSTKVQTLGTLDIGTVSHWGIYIASSYICAIIHLLGQLQRQAWKHEILVLRLLHSWSKDAQQSLAQLSATQQRPTLEPHAGPAMYMCWSELRARARDYTENCTLDKMAEIIEVSKKRSR